MRGVLRNMRWIPVRARVIALLATGLLVATLLPATSARAAATRYEAENATISEGVVESNHLGFSGTGFVNYTNVIGSYVEFTVNASAAGNATLAIRYANGSTADRPMDIAVNGTTVAAGASFAPTGNWDTWATKTITAAVTIGSNKIRATATTAGGGPNVDFLDVEVATTPTFTDYQAESATISQGLVESNHLGFTGTGFVNYGLTFRYSNGTTTNRPMDIAVNGVVVAPGLAFNPTTNWDTWADQSITAALTAGTNKVRATATTSNGGPNLDRLRVTNPTDTEPPTAPGNF